MLSVRFSLSLLSFNLSFHLFNMHTIQHLAAVVLLATSSFAAPAPAPAPASAFAPLVVGGNAVPEGGFTVQQVASGIAIKNGAMQVQKTLKKFKKAVPVHIAAAASSAKAAATTAKAVSKATESGTVVASPTTDDSEYICPVQIGSNSQTLLLDFDTGSSDL